MLQKLLADHCRKKYFGNHSKPVQIGVYRPSVLAWSCIRRQYNYYRNFHGKSADEIPDEVILLLAGGVVFHRLVQSLTLPDGKRYWDKVEVECSIEVQLPSGVIVIIGHADAIKAGKVYEFKHVRTLPNKPRFEHILQLNFYLKALNIVEGSLVYVGYQEGGGLGIREFHWNLSNWHFQHLVNRAETLHYLLTSGIPPRCSCRDQRHEMEVI